MIQLYQAVRDKVGRILLSEINNVIEASEQKAKTHIDENEDKTKADHDGINEIKAGLQEICERVADTFQCSTATTSL